MTPCVCTVESLESLGFGEIAAVFTRCFRGYSIEFEIDEETMRERFTKEGLEKALSFVLKDGDTGIAGICLNSSLENEVKCGGLAVDEKYRFKGLGDFFLKEIIKELRKKGFKRYHLEVLKDNPKALRLYLKNDFSVYGGIYVLKGNFPGCSSDKPLCPETLALDSDTIGMVEKIRGDSGHSDMIWTKRSKILIRDKENRVFFFEENNIVKGYLIYSEVGSSVICIKDAFAYDFHAGVFMRFLNNCFSGRNIVYHFIEENSLFLEYFTNYGFDVEYPQYVMCRKI